ncbi:hypothetical protein [Kitasatospora aureofaciens]|uniref:hypothetical protein n=1 Tax=Kitasatospora aureofaciens TaxID=1894 RepID=UPI0036F46356
MYGTNPADSPDYGRIVNERHFDRLTALLSDGRLVTGGDHDRAIQSDSPVLTTGMPDASAVSLTRTEYDEVLDLLARLGAADSPEAAAAPSLTARLRGR